MVTPVQPGDHDQVPQQQPVPVVPDGEQHVRLAPHMLGERAEAAVPHLLQGAATGRPGAVPVQDVILELQQAELSRQGALRGPVQGDTLGEHLAIAWAKTTQAAAGVHVLQRGVAPHQFHQADCRRAHDGALVRADALVFPLRPLRLDERREAGTVPALRIGIASGSSHLSPASFRPAFPSSQAA